MHNKIVSHVKNVPCRTKLFHMREKISDTTKLFHICEKKFHMHERISHARKNCFTCVKKKFTRIGKSFRIIFTCILKISHACESLLQYIYFLLLFHMVSVFHMLFTYSSHDFYAHARSSVIKMKSLFACFLAEKSVSSL